jgi:hypothetical protein
MSFRVDGIRHPVVQGVAAILAVLAILFGVNWCRARQAATHSKAEQRVEDARPAVAANTALVDSLQLELASVRAGWASAEAQWRARPAVPSGSRPGAHVTPLAATLPDSTPAVQLRALLGQEQAAHEVTRGLLADAIARGQALADSGQRLTLRAAELSVRVDSLQGAWRTLDRAYRELLAAPKPRRRWGAGCTGGYGAVASGGRGYVGPSATCGLAFSF